MTLLPKDTESEFWGHKGTASGEVCLLWPLGIELELGVQHRTSYFILEAGFCLSVCTLLFESQGVLNRASHTALWLIKDTDKTGTKLLQH